MPDKIVSFYSPLAEHYHLIFEDWDQSIDRQAKILNPLLASELRQGPLKILDCACGIGTQAIGFASYGHQVVASDVSSGAIARAIKETRRRCQSIAFYVSNMTSLDEVEAGDFDVVATLDNALPHLSPTELRRALMAIASKLRPDGLFIASIRDYDVLMLSKPAIQGPVFYGGEGSRRILLQVWDWIDNQKYALHQYITRQSGQEWISHHFVSEYRCLLRDELTAGLQAAGFEKVRWLMSAESGYFQPLVLARLRQG